MSNNNYNSEYATLDSKRIKQEQKEWKYAGFSDTLCTI